MSEIITVGLDLAKNVFQAHGADASGQPCCTDRTGGRYLKRNHLQDLPHAAQVQHRPLTQDCQTEASGDALGRL